MNATNKWIFFKNNQPRQKQAEKINSSDQSRGFTNCHHLSGYPSNVIHYSSNISLKALTRAAH